AQSLRQTVAEALLLRQNEEITRLNTELSRSNIELDSFAYAASHDLQEPVRTVRAYSQLLSRRASTQLDESGREMLKVIENGAARMGTLIAALLAYGQVGGSARREPQAVNLQHVLNLVLMNLEESIRTSGAVVTHDSLPVVQGDPDQLMQLLQNLLANSIKYRKTDEAARIHISAVLQGSNWRLGVCDNGEGISPQHLQTVFGAFKRLHGRDIPGTGIGLALCKRIVEHHGGQIWAESGGKGQGAEFYFTLPKSA
ncbi:MAG TPA: ATP-binding protein, partial [Bryobacteraceae bacterium]|nr:ATP-binding protein [Bryobacteraceae bacterium]